MIKLDQVNTYLSNVYKDKHTEITIDDINKVYLSPTILSVNSDSKTVKGQKLGYLTGILYLAPSKLSGMNMCPSASAGCKQACLFSAGRGQMYSVTRARIIKTLAFINNKDKFEQAIIKSIDKLIKKAAKVGLVPCVRLNGTSDLVIESVFAKTLDRFKDVQFYDYTKNSFRFSTDKIPTNYHLTFSLSETNLEKAKDVLFRGYNVAVVFRNELPVKFLNTEVIDGDDTDLRFLDKTNSVIGLKAKGKAEKDVSGFVI